MKTLFITNRIQLSVLTLIMLSSQFIKAEIYQPFLQIPKISTSVTIDGKLNDACWQKGAELSDFINWSLESYVQDAVKIILCYDEKNIYVAFRNTDQQADNLNKSVSPKRPRDTFLWGGNYVMVGINYKDVSVRIQADPKETLTDWKNEDLNWNGSWDYAASINKEDWTAEIRIPFGDLGLNVPPTNEELSISLSRSFPRGESSDWTGMCIFSGQVPVSCQYGKWPDPVPGKNSLSFNARNFGKENVNLVCELELIPFHGKPEFINQVGQGPSSDLRLPLSREPLRYKYNYLIPANGTINEKLIYNLPNEGSYYASVTVRSKEGKLLRRSRDYWFTIEPNREKIKVMKEKLGEGIAVFTRISNPVTDRFGNEAEKLERKLQQLENTVEGVWKSGKWDDLTAQVTNTDREISQFVHKVRWTALHNWKSEDDFGIGLIHSIVKLRKDDLFPQSLKDQICISAAKNEYESFQLAILPFGKDLEQLTLEVSDLTSKNGGVISKNKIELSVVDYNKIDWQPEYVSERKGWFPDPLIPYKQALEIKGTDMCRPIWVTVYIPPRTRAGEYTGIITVSAVGMKKVTAKVNCRVWDFKLPVESHLKTHTWDDISTFGEFYNLEEYPVDWYLRFCELLLKNRLNPGSAGSNYVSESPDKSGTYDFSRVEKVLGFCIERGLSRFSILQMKKGLYLPEEAEKVFAFAEAYAKFLRQKGWLDKALIELWDEPTDLEWPYIKERAERLKKIDPGLRLQLFAEGGPYDFFDRNTDKYGLNDLVDIWAPVNIIESPETQAKGGEIWAYFCTLAREAAPNFFIDCPAIYQRSIAWYCWMYGLDAFEHWSTNYFWRNVQAGKPMNQKWPNIPWDSRTYHYFNGEGQLVYPGPDGTPFSSIRLENFREGMEDYEYLFRLRELIAEHENEIPKEDLNAYRKLLSTEENLLYKYPRRIKKTLENTLRYPDQPERILDIRQKVAMAIEKLQNSSNADNLLLKNYRPVSIYKVPVTKVDKAAYPVIDMHSHDYTRTDAEILQWIKNMDACGIQKSIVMTQAAGPKFDSIYNLYAKYGDRFDVWCGFDYTGYDKPGYGPAAVKELERCYKLGARGVGEEGDKGLGLFYNDPVKAWGMHFDDPRMKPLFEKCAQLHMPVNLHIGDPIWMYEKMDSTNDGLMNAQEWRIDMTRPGIIGLNQLVQTLENAVRDNPNTTFIACHFANLNHDPAALGALFDKYPNLYADISARYAESATIPRYMKAFYEKYQDRLLYGTDMGYDTLMYRITFRVLESNDEHFYESKQFGYHWALNGFGLSRKVLKKVYHDNAAKILSRYR